MISGNDRTCEGAAGVATTVATGAEIVEIMRVQIARDTRDRAERAAALEVVREADATEKAVRKALFDDLIDLIHTVKVLENGSNGSTATPLEILLQNQNALRTVAAGAVNATKGKFISSCFNKFGLKTSSPNSHRARSCPTITSLSSKFC